MLRNTVFAALVVLMSVVPAFAQEATIVGAVTDEGKLILPGVSVTATEVSSGRIYDAITNERGEYRLLVGPGRYELKATLSGFATTVLSNLEFLVGQNATVPISLKVASVEESVTVTGASPLVDLKSAQIAGTVDQRQMESIPLAGRNWLDLSAAVAGLNSFSFGRFQLNLDGQQITQDTSVTAFGQQGISRDAIAQYQVITTPYDVSLGRSVGLEVEAISKSGTNRPSGSVYGYFRDDRLNSADPFSGVVLPFKQRQIGATFGGPIIRDKTHFFMAYELERNPSTIVIHPTALAPQQLNAATTDDKYNFLGRIDHQFSSRDHLVVRGNLSHELASSEGITTHPTRSAAHDVSSYSATANWTHAAAGGSLQELRAGYYTFYWTYGPGASPVPYVQTPEYNFPGLTMGLNWNYPEYWDQTNIPIRYDLTKSRGAHEIKIGGEWNLGLDHGDWPFRASGQMFFSRTPTDAATRFPLDQPATQWNFTGLDSTVTRFDQTYSSNYNYNVPRKQYAAWIGDTWRIHSNLTLNFGIRYDLSWGQFAPPDVPTTSLIINNGLFTEDVGYRPIRDTNNFGPRAGVVWNLGGNNDFVIRAGSGIFYSGVGANPAVDEQLGAHIITNSYANDGKPGFLADPTRGITAAQVLSGQTTVTSPQSIAVVDPAIQTPRSWQTTLGFQKQFGRVIGIDANLVYLRGYNEESVRDPNVFYDPATGFPKNPVTFGRPAAAYGPIRLIGTNGRSESLTLPVTFTKRYSKSFQLNATTTFVFFNRNAGVGGSGYGNDQINPFDINYNFGSAGSAFVTFRTDGVWNLPLGLNLSGVFRYSSGGYSTYSSGLDPLAGYGRNRLHADLSFIPRSTFQNDPSNSADVRLSKDFKLPNGVKLSAIAEMFNLTKATNNTYDLRENSATYLKVSNVTGIRSGQLAFRVGF